MKLENFKRSFLGGKQLEIQKENMRRMITSPRQSDARIRFESQEKKFLPVIIAQKVCKTDPSPRISFEGWKQEANPYKRKYKVNEKQQND